MNHRADAIWPMEPPFTISIQIIDKDDIALNLLNERGLTLESIRSITREWITDDPNREWIDIRYTRGKQNYYTIFSIEEWNDKEPKYG